MRQNWWRGIDRGERSPRPAGWGNPTPTHTASFAHVPIFTPPVSRLTCRPSGALGVWCNWRRVLSIVGNGVLAQRVWGTQPLRTVCGNTTLRSSGARVFHVSRCYRHFARLERVGGNAPNPYEYCIHRGATSPCPAGWSTQPLGHTTSVALVSNCRASRIPVNMSPCWG